MMDLSNKATLLKYETFIMLPRLLNMPIFESLSYIGDQDKWHTLKCEQSAAHWRK